jgi:hypothetical protein
MSSADTTNRIFRIVVLAVSLASSRGLAQTYDQQMIEGWTIQLNVSLKKADEAGLEKALSLLTIQLKEIVRVVPAGAVVELRKVPLYFNPEYKGTPPRAEFHPDEGWLRENGRDPAMVRAVEFTNVRIFEAECRRMPNFALHELAHAYHHRVLGFEHAEVEAAFQKAKASGKYDQVKRSDSEGRLRLDRAYAMTNAKEYFAEGTEAYFARNDFFPFDQKELLQHDPVLHDLVKKLWQVSQ